jgi:RNA polymerase sigma factor (sigma-70 family)
MAALPQTHARGRRYVVAMVLGTALTALSPGQASAAPAQPADRVVADVGRYCTACWRNARLPVSSWSDCTQEVYRRLLERLPGDAWGRMFTDESEERREFIRAIDAVKKREQRARKLSSSLDGVPDQRDDERVRDDEREEVRRAAAELLSPRQQQILQMSFEGWSVQDMAHNMNLPADRVSDEKYKAIRKLRGHLASQEA